MNRQGSTQMKIIEYDMPDLTSGTKVRATVLLPNTTSLPLRRIPFSCVKQESFG